MKLFIIIVIVGFSLFIISCGSGKTGDPTPVTTTGTTTTGGTTSGTTSGGTSTGGTISYTLTSKNINTIGGTIYFDAGLSKITKTGCSNANSGGIQTADGGSVTVELLNADNAIVNNLGDALDLTFAKTDDPILEYTETNETAKTKTKTDIHLNAYSGAHLYLQGTTLNTFKDNTIIYNAAYAISKAKSSTQSISYIAYK